MTAWNEALGLPRPWDQQWALRTQQIMAYETDILEYADIFNGSPVIQQKVDDLLGQARAELAKIEARKRGPGVKEFATAKALVTGASAGVAQYVAPPLVGEVPGEPQSAEAPTPEAAVGPDDNKVTPAPAATKQEG